MDEEAATMPTVPPALLDIIGEREHIKFILPLADQAPSQHAADAEPGTSQGSSSKPSVEDEMLVLVSNVDNADDAELSALLLLDTKEWNTLAVVPVLPGLLEVQSHQPNHIQLVLKVAGQKNQGQERELLHGWSSQDLLVQDFRLILSQISSSTSSQLSQTRWMWLKRYTTQEQFASIRKLLAAQRESTKSPVWAKFSTSSAPSSVSMGGKPSASSAISTSTSGGVRIVAFSYNVAGCAPPPPSTSLPFLTESSLQHADLAVIGLQEVDLSSAAYLFFDSQKQDAWGRVLLDGLNRGREDDNCQWTLKVVKQHVTILLFIFQRIPPQDGETALNERRTQGAPIQLSELLVTTVGVGLGGFMANKGAVAARFRVTLPMGASKTICIIAAHLSAGVGRIAMERRVWDWAEIGKRLRFKIALNDSPTATLEEAESFEEWGVLDHDATLLLGDLNSRLPLSLSSASVQRLLRKGATGRRLLRSYDELSGHLAIANEDGSTRLTSPTGEKADLASLASEEVNLLIRELWRDWKEGDVSDFAPTYKLDPGTNTYDTSEKQRVPSWTDRVLWFEGGRGQQRAVLEQYNAVLEGGGIASDHLPVCAVLRIPMN